MQKYVKNRYINYNLPSILKDILEFYPLRPLKSAVHQKTGFETDKQQIFSEKFPKSLQIFDQSYFSRFYVLELYSVVM